MKKFLLAILACSVLPALALAKVYTFDLQKTVEQYTAFQAEIKEVRIQSENLNVEGKQKEAELQALVNEIKLLVQDRQKSELLTDDAKKKLDDQINEKQKAFETKQDQSRKEFQPKVDELRKKAADIESKHVAKIREVVKTLGQSKGADLILNSSANSPVVFYSVEYIDITKEVVEAINKK